MCVIIIARNKTPMPLLLEKSERINRDGAGIAWRNPVNGKIRVEKGLTWQDVHRISSKAPFPQIMHFRAATSGGRSPLLTHPFPISNEVELELSGEYDSVMAHNGHCSRSEGYVEKMAKERYWSEKWSDSRAMAYCLNQYGPKWLESSYQRVAIFDKNGISMHGWWDLNLTNIALSTNVIAWSHGTGYLDDEDQKEYDQRHIKNYILDEEDESSIKAAQGHSGSE